MSRRSSRTRGAIVCHLCDATWGDVATLVQHVQHKHARCAGARSRRALVVAGRRTMRTTATAPGTCGSAYEHATSRGAVPSAGVYVCVACERAAKEEEEEEEEDAHEVGGDEPDSIGNSSNSSRSVSGGGRSRKRASPRSTTTTTSATTAANKRSQKRPRVFQVVPTSARKGNTVTKKRTRGTTTASVSSSAAPSAAPSSSSATASTASSRSRQASAGRTSSTTASTTARSSTRTTTTASTKTASSRGTPSRGRRRSGRRGAPSGTSGVPFIRSGRTTQSRAPRFATDRVRHQHHGASPGGVRESPRLAAKRALMNASQ